MHPLENVIWNALTTRHAQFAQGAGDARRFIPEVGPLGGFTGPAEAGYQALAELIGKNGTVGLFLDEPYQERPGWTFIVGAPLLQMVWQEGTLGKSEPIDSRVERLGDRDSAEMIELTALTKPGPFSTRTHELGVYVGIRDGGKLVAMSGERLKVPGYTEVSAVCTHPEHTGKGYARVLMSTVMDEIRRRGETPFLHVRGDNNRAIAIYEQLGFRISKRGHFAVLRRD